MHWHDEDLDGVHVERADFSSSDGPMTWYRCYFGSWCMRIKVTAQMIRLDGQSYLTDADWQTFMKLLDNVRNRQRELQAGGTHVEPY